MKYSEILKELEDIEKDIKRAKKLTNAQRFALGERIADLRKTIGGEK